MAVPTGSFGFKKKKKMLFFYSLPYLVPLVPSFTNTKTTWQKMTIYEEEGNINYDSVLNIFTADWQSYRPPQG